MRIAICASEGAPYAKSGGLGDVMEALPAALQRIEGNEVVLFLPFYNKIKENAKYETEMVAQFRVSLGWRQQYCGLMKLTNRTDGVQVYFIDNEYYFGGRTGAIYGDLDDGERFAYFSRACLDAMVALGYTPDVIQCNDWQCALIPTYLKSVYRDAFPNTRCMYTIHNIEYQGWANGAFFDDVLGLPWEYRGTLDMGGSVNVMKGAIETCDLVTTVSETYARELMYPYYAHGLDGILSNAAWKLTGITNGIDTNTFNPETDAALPAHFNADTFHIGKAECKAELQRRMGLEENPDIPIIAMVTRMTEQKGFDLVASQLDRLICGRDVEFMLLGTGESRFEDFMRGAEARYKGRVCAYIGYNEELAHLVYAGSDFYLLPSRFEPCGLSQMIAMRYGTVPIVRETGGLKDTVQPYNCFTGEGNGFSFANYNADEMYDTILYALGVCSDKKVMKYLVSHAMEADFSFDLSAEAYARLYVCML